MQVLLGDIIGQTPHGGAMTLRGNEIYQWIKDNEDILGDYYKFKEYVILDDDSDMLLWQANNYINCDGYVGMTGRTVHKAKQVLNRTLSYHDTNHIMIDESMLPKIHKEK